MDADDMFDYINDFEIYDYNNNNIIDLIEDDDTIDLTTEERNEIDLDTDFGNISWDIDRTPSSIDHLINDISETIILHERIAPQLRQIQQTLTAISLNSINAMREVDPIMRNSRTVLENSRTTFDHFMNSDYTRFQRYFVKPQPAYVHKEFEVSEEDKTCCICMEDKEKTQICMLECCHKFCLTCINSHTNQKTDCPLCRKPINKVYIQPINLT